MSEEKDSLNSNTNAGAGREADGEGVGPSGNGQSSGNKLVAGLIIGILAILVMTGLVWATMIQSAPAGETTASDKQAEPEQAKVVMAPDVILKDHLERTVMLKGAMPTPRYYYFWATWCSVCRDQNPMIKAAFQKYGARIDFYAINLTATEETETLNAWIANDPFPFVMLFDPENAAAESYDIQATPTQVFITKSGRIVDRTYSLEPEELDRRLASLLSQE